MTANILIVGGAGFIGSHTADFLLQQGNSVTILDNLSSGKLTNLDLTHPNLEFIEGDALEYFLLEDLLKNCDAVLHLAAIASVSQTIENPLYSMQVNTLGLLHVLEAAKKINKAIRVVYASSAAVYGDEKNLPCDDARPLTEAPLSPYSLQKIHAEHYAELYFRLYGIRSLGLRYFNVYGTRQDPNSPYSGVISKFLQANRDGAPLQIFGDGKQSRDFIYIDDVARANDLALSSNYVGALNIATGKSTTLLELAGYLPNASAQTLEFQPGRAGDIYASYASTSLAAASLGFRSEVDIKTGLADLVKSL